MTQFSKMVTNLITHSVNFFCHRLQTTASVSLVSITTFNKINVNHYLTSTFSPIFYRIGLRLFMVMSNHEKIEQTLNENKLTK